MSNPLVKQISQDLNIHKFNDETDESFGNRLIYSAIASWVRMLVLGKSYTDLRFSEETDYPEVDINHIQNRASHVAYGLILSIPHEENWITVTTEEQSSELASIIIGNMKFCFEISELNDSRRITTSPNRNVYLEGLRLHLGGVRWNNNLNLLYTFGFGRWEPYGESKKNLRAIFNIPNANHQIYFSELIKNARWKQKQLNGNYEIFKTGSNGYYRDAWRVVDIGKIPQGISLIRNTEDGGYLLVKRAEQVLSVVLLDNWYYLEKEIFRIMYALDANFNTHAKFNAENKQDHVILHCHSKLPNAETRLLLLSSWPKRNSNDIYYRIIPALVWKQIKKVIENLGIIIVDA